MKRINEDCCAAPDFEAMYNQVLEEKRELEQLMEVLRMDNEKLLARCNCARSAIAGIEFALGRKIEWPKADI